MQHWLRGGISEDIDPQKSDEAASLRDLGVPEQLIARQCALRTDFAVLPRNETTVLVWCAIAATQWSIVAGFGGAQYIGLRYEALPAVLDLLQVPPDERPRVFRGIRLMERVALRALNEAPGGTGRS